LTENNLGLTYIYAQPSFQGGKKGEEIDFSEKNQNVSLNLVYNMRNLFKKSWPLALGITLTLDRNGEGFIHFRDVRNPNGEFIRYGDTSFLFATGIGVKATDWMYVGVGALGNLHASTNITLTTNLAGETSNESMDMKANLAISPAASLFFKTKPIDIGITYRSKSYGQNGPMVVPTTATVGESKLAEMPLNIVFKDSYYPHQVAAGMTWKITEKVLWTWDLTWFNWSDFPKEVSKNDKARKDLDLKFIDTFVPQTGVEWNVVSGLFLRFGYGYDATPVVDGGNSMNMMLDSNKHKGSLGVGYTWTNPPVLNYPFSIDAAYFHQYLVPRSMTSSDFVKYESSGNLNGGALSITLRF